jgi:hypothetical protein
VKFKAPSYPVLAAVAYAIFAAFGIAIWYPLLFVAVPTGTSTLQTLQDLLAYEPGGHLLGLHTVASLIAAVVAGILFVRPIVTRRASLTAAIGSTLFAVAVWALYRSDTALLPTVGAGALAWNYFKSPVVPSEA